jgi:hypothetical protein
VSRFTNLVANPGGETGTVGVQAPSWTFATGNPLAPATDAFRSGARSLRIVNATGADSSSYQDFAVTVGKKYLLSGWIRTSAMSGAGGGAILNVDALSGVTGFTIHSKVGFNPNAAQPDVGLQNTGIAYPDFTYVECLFTPTGANGTIRLFLHLGYAGNVQGTAWFDDLRLVAGGEILQAIEKDSAEFVHLIEMNFGAGPVRVNTGAQDLNWNGFTWQAVGGLMEIGGIEETNDGKGQGLDLKLSGVDQTILAVLLTSDYRGRTAKIYRAHLNTAAGTVIENPLLLFQGLQLSAFQVDESQDSRKGGTVTISTRLSGYFGVERVRGIQTNVISHQHEYAGETFFQHTASLATAKIYWGTALPRTAIRKAGKK